jgi:Flp pilus assembly pilin Flp
MKTLTSVLAKLRGARDGNISIEYGLIAALIAGVLIVGVTSMGTSLNGRLDDLASRMTPG